MKKFLIIFFVLIPSFAHSRIIDQNTKDKIYLIGTHYGVPVSITDRLMYEESRYWDDAQSPIVDGYVSRGLFQIYTKPENLNYLLNSYWKENRQFDIYNAIDNATLALAYLAGLHRQYKTWYRALLFYNHGGIETA